jgi:uncharacterized protein
MDIWWLLFAVGFVAQLVDGALGMAYGLLTNTALLAMGLPPAVCTENLTWGCRSPRKKSLVHE